MVAPAGIESAASPDTADWPRARLRDGWHPARPWPRNLPHVFVRNTIARSVADACREWRRRSPGGVLLDVGSGSQPYRPWVDEAGLRYVGVDAPGSDHEIPPDRVVKWDLTRRPWPFETSSFDAVLCTEVIEHLPCPDTLLDECARVMRPGGLLLLTAPFVWPEHEAPADYRRFTRFEMRAAVERAGFDVLDVTERGGWHLALAQILGCWAHFAWPQRAVWLVSALVWPIVVMLSWLDRPRVAGRPFVLSLGYSVLAARRGER